MSGRLLTLGTRGRSQLQVARLFLGDLAYVLLFAVLLFIPAGTLSWPRAWVLLATLLVLRLAATVSTARVHRSLLVERSRLPLHGAQSLADKVLLISFMASFAALVAFASIDVFHLHLLPAPSDLLAGLGLLLFVLSWAGVAQVLRTNAFAVTVVRHQEERNQRVVSAGPYSFVRHPMYASLIPIFIGLALWLGSVAAAIAAVVPVAILVARIQVEEQYLHLSLPGYSEYAGRVRWRLIPGIW